MCWRFIIVGFGTDGRSYLQCTCRGSCTRHIVSASLRGSASMVREVAANCGWRTECELTMANRLR